MAHKGASLLPDREFHVSREARQRYDFDDTLFSLRGEMIFANFQAARQVAERINRERDVIRHPERAVRAGQLNAMGLIDEILHFVIEQYRRQKKPNVLREALEWLETRLGRETVDQVLWYFVDRFPTTAVYRGGLSARAYLEGETNGVPNREIALEELLTLWLDNENPAFAPLQELFDDAALEQATAYGALIDALYEFFEHQPRFGPENQNLIDMLLTPARVAPHSLEEQLAYIRTRWAFLLGDWLVRLLSSLDLIAEENRAWFTGPGPAQVYEYAGLQVAPERYSPDLDWMPQLVLIAKNTYVWLDQLSKAYQRPIVHLDDIPDEELDRLARWGISGIWLIGVWERSPASRKIKQMCGNPDAVASAYAIFDYVIAQDLGGEEAFQRLKARAWQRGIRLASDMVPNHVGIDGKWVIEHPDWFISLDYSPFPSYTFNGPDLSWHDQVGIYLEDHYYTRTDAAVVFKRVDRRTGQELYIYHGNDGTSMPWNDTAQLNYLKPEVREAVIQTILAVARRFPIIRFDAAMTLTKQHYQRLWFPEPGTGGDIPSRAGQGMTKAEFDALMPNEFWREVVDRVAQEAPDTLLLAEAFWLLEGYFVRTLGMHRVYNSAFMNMLKAEENAKYRQVMKNTLEFDPQLLKRFVNFMSNPDEETAVAQFGKGDKYFGVCVMMATLPGLPMFAHGQIEGFAEKYGMEYRRAYWDEKPDWDLIRRHEREVFPLLRRRYLFAEVDDFVLYDVRTPDGAVCEDIFAYSNRRGMERALVVYHNRYARAAGWIRDSVQYAVKAGEQRELRQTTLGAALGLRSDEGVYYIFRDHVADLEYIRSGRELTERGLFVDLGAYQYHVFLDFREVVDVAGRYAALASELNGRGVPSIDEALRQRELRPLLEAIAGVLHPTIIRALEERIQQQIDGEEELKPPEALLSAYEDQLRVLLGVVSSFSGAMMDVEPVVARSTRRLEAALDLLRSASAEAEREVAEIQRYLVEQMPDAASVAATLLGWLAVDAIGRAAGGARDLPAGRVWMDEWSLGRPMAEAYMAAGWPEHEAWTMVTMVKILATHSLWHRRLLGEREPGYVLLRQLLSDGDVSQVLRVNRFEGALWFHHESFLALMWWLMLAACLEEASEAAWARAYRLIRLLLRAEAESGYQVERLASLVEVIENGDHAQATGRPDDAS
ncbi:MAG: hypothetical protein Kow0047_00860 [Anaerolineae bacterium]